MTEGFLGTISALCGNRNSAYSAVVFDTVIPEARGRELLPDHHSHSVYYALTHSHNVS